MSIAPGKIVIAGGTGFIGEYLAHQWRAAGHEVKIISRQPGHIGWTDAAALTKALEGADILVNLAGKSVNCRYTEKNKEAILQSRVETTELLGAAIARCTQPPALWLNSSTATIYRHAEDRPMTEASGEIGNGFSVSVARAWEESFFSFASPATRQVALRIAIVLGSTGGVMKPYENLVRCGLGGRQGNGRQMFSWIHIEDLYRIITFLWQHPEITGVVNCAAPHPVANAELMHTLREVMHTPVGLPAPRWLLQAGAWMIGTETELVLKSRWVLPERLQQEGFSFAFPHLKSALMQIVRKE